MSLAVGSRLGPYEVLEPLGAGGMGEVYRARDAKLNRDVAIKVLPELFSADPERLTRFRREAQVLASLNHPNIGHIYGLEDSSGAHALVLELVEGPTLADRVAEGPIPLDDAIPIARQIADALECAHEQGIIHRDLKPANIKLRPDGTVKVLDFGLAKAFESTTGSGAEVMNSPTLTARGTQMGVIVGTAAYMAPEQARGKAVDRRADIWAFGVVLYEMLTGKRAFEGDDISITLASVLKDDLDWKALPADLPPSVMRVLRRCLEKDPKRRLTAIGDARLDLEDTALTAERATSGQPPVQAIPLWRRALPWTVAAAALVLAVGTLVLAGWRAAPAPDLVRVTSAIGAPGSLYLSGGPAFALSPDGKTLALVVNASGRRQIYVRRLANLEATPLAGTEEASAPFFSPDGQWIAFFAGGKLKKIAVTGGAAMPLCDAQNGRGGTWTADGTIIFQRNAAASAPLHRVGEGGGTSEPFGALAEGETTQRWPQALPGGHVLYTGNVTGGGWDTATLMVRPHDGSAAKVVVPGGYYGRYVPATSHLVYINRAVLYAVPFDLARLQTSGNAVPVIDGVLAAANGSAHITISDTGRVVYLPGHAVGIEAPVHLVDKAGKLTVLRSQVADWYSPRFSPDGTKLALTIGAFPGADVWIHEADRDLTKLTFNSQADAYPVWTPDGSRIAFSSAINGPILNLFWRRANGTGEPQRLTTSPNAQLAGSFHKSGKFLAFTERTVERDNDVMILELEGDEKSGWTPKPPTAFVATPFSEGSPSFSPDGRWMAYVSGESGRPEIYVQPFPAGDGRWKVSTDSGIHPVWSPARSELLYLQLGGQFTVMAVPYSVQGASFRAQAPIRWTPQLVQPHGGDRPYDVHPNGNLVAFVKPPDDQSSTAVNNAVFIFDFFEELRRVAAKK